MFRRRSNNQRQPLVESEQDALHSNYGSIGENVSVLNFNQRFSNLHKRVKRINIFFSIKSWMKVSSILIFIL